MTRYHPARRLAVALRKTDAALAELQHVLEAPATRREAVMQSTRQREESEARQ